MSDTEVKLFDNEGHERLWTWFGLSYASFITIPRVLAHAMPDEWQNKMAALLEEYDAAFPNQPPVRTRVQLTDMRGKIMSLKHGPYAWLLNYRHPDHDAIDSMKD